jgi:hypothetical protein
MGNRPPALPEAGKPQQTDGFLRVLDCFQLHGKRRDDYLCPNLREFPPPEKGGTLKHVSCRWQLRYYLMATLQWLHLQPSLALSELSLVCWTPQAEFLERPFLECWESSALTYRLNLVFERWGALIKDNLAHIIQH